MYKLVCCFTVRCNAYSFTGSRAIHSGPAGGVVSDMCLIRALCICVYYQVLHVILKSDAMHICMAYMSTIPAYICTCTCVCCT